MHMNDKKTILPKLRFEEFNSYPKWEITTLGEISKPIEEKVGDKICTLMSVTAGKGLVPQKEKFGREIAGNSYKNYYVIKKNDFAYNKSATKQFPEGYIAMLTDYDEAALPNSIFTCSWSRCVETTTSNLSPHILSASLIPISCAVSGVTSPGAKD